MPSLDDYGNKKPPTQSRGGPRSSLGSLPQLTRMLGFTPPVIKRGRTRKFGGGGTPPRTDPFPPPPASWTGTLPEWAIFWAHGVLGRVDRQDFQYQYFYDTGYIFDFFEFQERIAIEIQGLYWHYEFQGGNLQNDMLRKIRAESAGITMIFIDEDHALSDPVYYLREALNFRDHSRAVRGQ